MGTTIFDIVTLTLTFDLLLKYFSLGHSFLTRRGRAFVLHMYIPCDKTCPWITQFLTLWPWPWSLTFFKKNFNLGHSFLTRRGRAFIFHICIPCSKIFNAVQSNMIFDVVTLTLRFDLLYKTIDGDYDFWITGVIYCCYLHMVAAGELCCLSDNSGWSLLHMLERVKMSFLLLLMLLISYLNYRTFVKESLLSSISHQSGPWSKGERLGLQIWRICF